MKESIDAGGAAETKRKGRTRLELFALALCLGPFVLYLAFTLAVFLPAKWKSDGERTAAAERLAPQIEAFRKSAGHYPAKLDELGSGAAGDAARVSYAVVDSGAAFTLSFGEAPMMPMDDSVGLQVWSSKTRAWAHVDIDPIGRD